MPSYADVCRMQVIMMLFVAVLIDSYFAFSRGMTFVLNQRCVC